MNFRVQVKAMLTKETNSGEVKAYFVDIGFYDVSAGGFDAAADKGIAAAKENPTYKDVTNQDVTLVVTSIKLLTKANDL